MATSAFITLDLHGKNTYQARITIDAALRRADSSVYRIKLIHGYHNGTAIKEMIKEEYSLNPKVIELNFLNSSVTELILRKL